MRLAVGLVNVALGCIYTSYGIMTLIDMKRGWQTMGFSHFGAAWITMAFTCGPHHLNHGAHLLLTKGAGGPLDLFAVLIGAPAGLTWFLLRVEAFRGGRGDRFIEGTPAWLKAGPTMAGIYLTAFVAAFIPMLSRTHRFTALSTPNLFLLILYSMIGYYLLRTQVRNHHELQGWSLSGLSLGVVFPTCAMMHVVMAVYASTGVYDVYTGITVIDWLAVPSAVYFLWVVRALYRDALVDWNRGMTEQPVATPAKR